MAFVLKQGSIFLDRFGINHDQAYGVIDVMRLDRRNRSIDIQVDLYTTQQARTDGMQPVKKIRMNCIEEEDFTRFVATMNASNIYAAAYEFVRLQANEMLNDFEDDTND
jgi:aspartate/tyrosine/aromatic aminotransferase